MLTDYEIPVSPQHSAILDIEAEIGDFLSRVYASEFAVDLQLRTPYLTLIGKAMPNSDTLLTFDVDDTPFVGAEPLTYLANFRFHAVKALQASIGDGPGAAEVAEWLDEIQSELVWEDEPQTAEAAGVPGVGQTFSAEQIRTELTDAEVSEIGRIECSATDSERIEQVGRILAHAQTRLRGIPK